MYHMQRKLRLPEDHARFYAAEIGIALNFLHARSMFLYINFFIYYLSVACMRLYENFLHLHYTHASILFIVPQ